MYRGKRYRIGSSAVKKSVSTTSTLSTVSENTSLLSSLSTVTNPRITSTPNESVAGPSNILKECNNLPSSQSSASQNQPAIISNDDDFVVPTSQVMQPSRYISQRSALLRSQISYTQQTPMSYFESVLHRCGVMLSDRNSDVSLKLNCDHLKFVIRLRRELTSHPKYPENVQTFLSGLLDVMKNSNQMTKILSSCIITLPNSDLTKTSTESVMNDFLMIQFMQKDIIEILMRKIKALAIEETNASNMEIELLLAQLKFVDHLSHGDFVCTEIFDALETASTDARRTIIKSLEDIVDLTRHNDVIEKLMQLLPKDADLLNEETIDTFGNLCLNPSTHSQICQKIIRYIKNNAPNDLLPCFTKFILKFSTEDAVQLRELIENLRLCLRWPEELPTTRANIQKNQRDVFGCISRTLIRSKQLFDVWLKLIQSNTERYKPIDLIILLMMTTINDEKSVAIENIIRRKLKADIIDVKLLEETIRILPIILLDYSKVLFELLDSFVRDKNTVISNFANVGYRLIFGIETCDRKVLLSRLVGFVCERNAQAMVLADSGIAANKSATQTDLTTSALMILSEINRKYPSEMKFNGLQMLRLIDHSSDFSLGQFRLVMNIICSIAYSDPPCEELKDLIDMMVKKQVSSSIKNVKNRGIIGVVRVIDNMVWERKGDSGSDDLNSSYSTIESLPTRLSKVAANYIELAITSSQSCPQHLALFFDELASVFVDRNHERLNHQINRPFLTWLMGLVTGYFENNFIIDQSPASSAQWDLQIIRALNTDEEMEQTETDTKITIAIDIAGTLLNPSGSALNSVTILASLFNLMRVLYFRRYDGNLSLINAIVGAGIVLPQSMDPIENVDIFDEFDDDRARRVLDMYFYTVNVFRECVSAYTSQQNMRQKVLTRLSEILEWEQKIKETLAFAPDDYVPPTCIFLTESSVSRSSMSRFKRPGAKRTTAKKKKAISKTQTSQLPSTANETVTDTAVDATIQPSARAMSTKRSNDWSLNLNEFLRCMDPDVLVLFEENLVMKYPLPREFVGKSLGLIEFKFLLEDLTQKIESIFGVRKFSNTVETCQSIAFPAEFISDVVDVLPRILSHFDQVAKQLKEIIKSSEVTENNDDDDTESESISEKLFSDEANMIKVCFGLCIRLVAALFTWPEFSDDANKDTLKRALKAVIGEAAVEQDNISEMALAAVINITKSADVAVDLHSAVYMFHFAQAVIKHTDAKDAYHTHVVTLCKGFLSRKWYSFEGREMQGGEYNSLLEQLLKGYIKDAKFSFIRSNLQWIETEINDLKTKGGSLITFPCIKIVNYPTFYREIFTALIDSMHRKLDKNAQSSNQLKHWDSSIRIIDKLLNIAKLVDLSRVFFYYLKNTHSYIKLFLQHGMTTIEATLRRKVDESVTFLQSLQKSTRFLHTLCCHSKTIKDTAIIALIPTLRETNSQLVYKVEAALAANKCLNNQTYWCGNLKNKDIYNEDILSQATSITRSTLSGDNESRPSTSSGESSRKSASQKAKPRKRKLRSIGEEYEEAEGESSTKERSRSRCF
ncbi:Fanconi anemia group D2 protein [Contarinia nasturtii]|uniref:Fanconi anemia group D2 protein n=1 Tax=Contarinia nasturtii TaxID=265458 RepID=UPI0012D43A7C|nr:Fanconi anemia group D2 protein [Contarinia nasturtii]